MWADCWNNRQVAAVAERLTRPDILTCYGLRTLADTHPACQPEGYHRGAIWPFDTWLSWAGLRRIDHPAARRVRLGVLDALEILGGAPELYAVSNGKPARIPIANQIQAWTVGARWALQHDWAPAAHFPS